MAPTSHDIAAMTPMLFEGNTTVVAPARNAIALPLKRAVFAFLEARGLNTTGIEACVVSLKEAECVTKNIKPIITMIFVIFVIMLGLLLVLLTVYVVWSEKRVRRARRKTRKIDRELDLEKGKVRVALDNLASQAPPPPPPAHTDDSASNGNFDDEYMSYDGEQGNPEMNMRGASPPMKPEPAYGHNADGAYYQPPQYRMHRRPVGRRMALG